MYPAIGHAAMPIPQNKKSAAMAALFLFIAD
jgi:hypothetical protein